MCYSNVMCSVESCNKAVAARSWCSAHYMRWKRTGSPEGTNRKSPEERFWLYVDRSRQGCWRWIGSLSTHGYGQLSVNKRPVFAHRFSYELHTGPIPKGLDIDHLCRVRNCVNPQHLEAVTRKVNLSRGISPSAVAVRTGKCSKGHPFDESNTYVTSEGKRRCRKCQSNRQRAYNRRALRLLSTV
jgi:hypothetical protein